ncbi:MAG: pilus assembly protein N-terminal domain-containing protein [Pyrinomonadaceae bacterium]|nr:pilus assembly protein N-terminal domain-containing protein [Pyrinomonadaceae bacterium]
MRILPPLNHSVVFARAVLMVFAITQLALAQDTSVNASFANPQKESTPVNVLVGQSRVLTFDQPISRFSVSNPEVAEAVLVSPDQALVNGKKFGQVNFIAWNKAGTQFIVFDVAVRANLSLIDSQMRALFPKDDIRLSQANESVVLSGTVADPKTAEQADKVIQAAGFKTVNMLQAPVKNAMQVQLQVRVAEVNRNRLRDFGASYSYQGGPGTGGYINPGAGPGTIGDVAGGVLSGSIASSLNLFLMGGNTLSFIRALQQQGALRALAEPNLIAMDGQEASFLAGGEFPIPVVQGGGDRSAVTIVFKKFGVQLNFKPTIIDEDHIRLELEPEVSTLDYANGVRLDGFVIPALRTRRAKTGVELRDGQSFALAGLLDNNESRLLGRVPVIGSIPILGALFRSKQFQKNETELMFIVTAQMVKPLNRDDLPQLRGVDGLKNGSPLGVEQKGDGISGASGHSTGDATTQKAASPVTTPSLQPTPKPAATPTALPATGTGAVSLNNSSATPSSVVGAMCTAADGGRLIVAGAVYLPGSFAVNADLTLREGLRLAGGTNLRAGRSVYVIRSACTGETATQQSGQQPSQQVAKSVETYERTAAEQGNAVLQQPLRAGDAVFVPEVDVAFVTGAIARPDVVAARGTLTLLKALQSLGGTLDSARRDTVRMRRLLPDGASYQKFVINLNDIEQQRVGDVTLAPGDIVEIPSVNNAGDADLLAALFAAPASHAETKSTPRNRVLPAHAALPTVNSTISFLSPTWPENRFATLEQLTAQRASLVAVQ